MKKFISLSVATVMLVSMLLSMSAFALTYSNDIHANIDFSNFTTQNTPGVNGWNDALGVTSGTGKYAFDKAGSGADFIPAKGMFGKSSDDTCVKVEKFDSEDSASIYAPSKRLASGTLGAGDSVVINFNMAFGDKNADHYTYAEFYPDQKTGIGDRKYFYATSLEPFPESNVSEEPLIVKANGELELFGETLPNQLHYDTDKWYNFEIRITNGNTSEQVYCLAELYIDGIKFGETSIKPYTGSYQMNGIAHFYFHMYGGHEETLYLDDLQVGFFRTDASNDMYTEMHQSYELTSESDAHITEDNIHINLKYDMSVEEFLSDISYNERTSTQTGITEVKILKADRSEASPTDIIEDGWYARVKVEGDWNSTLLRNVYRYYYRKFTIPEMVDISDFALTSTEAGEITTATATLTNNTDSSYSAGVMLAVYNEYGWLEAVTRFNNLELLQGENYLENELSLTLPQSFGEGYKVKIFVTEANDYLVINEAVLN